LAERTSAAGSIIVNVLTMLHGVPSDIVAVYVPATKLFLVNPEVLPSLQTNVTGVIPPVRFKFILPLLAPKHVMFETIGLTVKKGASEIITVIGFVHPLASVICTKLN
jgi:hypothetical protein